MTQVLFDRLKSNLAQCINDGTIYFVTDSNGNFTQIALGDGSKSHVVGIGPNMDDTIKQELMSKLGLTPSANMGTIQLGKLANHNGVSSQKVVTYERTGLGTDTHEISTVGYVQQYMKTAQAMVYAGVFNAQTKEITDYNNAIISPSEEGNVTFDYLLNGNEGETLLTTGMSFIVGTAGDLEGYTGINVYGGQTKVEVGDMIIIINVHQKEGDEGGSTYNEASILIIQNTNLKISDGSITTAKLADGAVTNEKLSTDIQSLISNLSKTATFAGIATPTTNPGTPDGKVFYIANGKGTYTNFGGIDVTEDEVVVLYYDTIWHKEATGIASQGKLTDLERRIEQLPNNYFDITEIKLSSNLLNPETCNTGLITSNGTIFTGGSYDNYVYTDFIPVESGKSYTLQWGEDTVIKGREKANFARCCLYDGYKNVVSGGSDSPIQVLRIPNGVSFVRVCIYVSLQMLSTKLYALVEGEAIIDFEQYSPIIEKFAILKSECNNDEHIKTIAKSVMPTDEHIKEVAVENYTENNLFVNPTEGVNFWDNTFSWAGSDSSNESYCTYMFEVKPNTMYYFYQGFGYSYGTRTINEYNASKVYISGKSISYQSVYKTGADTKYLRVTFYRGNNSVIEIKEIIANGESVKAFIPDIIYCAVGRTIDIYNNQVCANADKYHFKWICDVGKSLKRKFSVKGVSASDKALRLVIYDDYLNVRYAKDVTLKIVANTISTNHTIVPLGDSLTNGKNWLAEVESLSADKIAYVGTYNFSVEDSSGVQKTGSHDGRSGAEPIDYLTSASFSKGGITYSNSWWDGSRFSFNAFKVNTGKNPDCIQIWLGTNGIQNPEQASYIKQLVDNIRMDNTTIPIIVCDTIFRGNQNGIGNQGGVDGYSVSGDSFKYNEDCRVITLKKNLHNLLVDYSNVFLVDLGISHDSEYNFETSEVPVNPRALQKEVQQVESVHPASQGYFQIADILFSAYCAILT